MKIIDKYIEDESTVVVVATANNETLEFRVQLTDFKYDQSRGCELSCGFETIDNYDEDYPNFDFKIIIDEAERFAIEQYNQDYTEKEIEFNCAVNDDVVIMKIDNYDDSVQLLIKDYAHETRYTEETSMFFENEESALNYCDQFRNDSEYYDICGLYALLQHLRKETY